MIDLPHLPIPHTFLFAPRPDPPAPRIQIAIMQNRDFNFVGRPTPRYLHIVKERHHLQPHHLSRPIPLNKCAHEIYLPDSDLQLAQPIHILQYSAARRPERRFGLFAPARTPRGPLKTARWFPLRQLGEEQLFPHEFFGFWGRQGPGRGVVRWESCGEVGEMQFLDQKGHVVQDPRFGYLFG